MKKRCISLLLAAILLLSMLPTAVFAALETAEIGLCVAKDTAIGMNGISNITITEGMGTVYLPGTAEPSKCRLQWSDPDLKINGQESGTVAIPLPGESESYTLTKGGEAVQITLHTLQGSKEVSGLFFTVDESLGTISAMNKDRQKETCCYGSVNLDGEEMVMSMKGRGNSTWTNFDKKPYNFTTYTDDTYTTKEKHELIEDTKESKWSIIANAKDSTLLRNWLALTLANRLDIGVPCRFVDVWLNGAYNGCYLMTAKNDYKAPKTGYMIEIDNTSDPIDPQFSVKGFDGSRAPTFTIKENGAGLSTSEIKAYVQKASTAILDGKSSDYLNYIDVESWARMYLLNELYKTTDVVSGSIFFTRAGTEDSDKLVAGPVWDFDVALGRAWAKSVTTVEDEAQVSGGKWYIDNIETKAWYRALGQHSELMERVYSLYNEYKADFEAMPELVRQQNEIIRASAEMNFDRWDVNRDKDHNPFTCTEEVTYGEAPYSVTYIAASTRDDYVTNLFTYLNTRLKFLSDRLTVAPAEGSITGNPAVKSGDALTLQAKVTPTEGTTYQWQSSQDGESWTDLAGQTGDTLTLSAAMEMNGIQYRCMAKTTGAMIEDVTHVAKVQANANAAIGPVTVTVTAGEHTHSYSTEVIAPTCTEAGYTLHTCTICGEGYQDTEVPALGHSFKDGKCTRCGMEPYPVTFDCDSHCTVTVYRTHDPADGTQPTDHAYACDSETGIALTDGDGQINFAVIPDAGYVVKSVNAEPLTNFKNLKYPADTGLENGYRVTKIKGAVHISITTEQSTQNPFVASFVCDEHCTVTAYDTQTLENGHEKALTAEARSSTTGAIDTTGDGQVNFVVEPEAGYEIETVSAEPTEHYRNLKQPTDTGVENGYRITKMTGDVTVTVTTKKTPCTHTYKAVVTKPTCTEAGYTTYTCTKCGDSYTAEETKPLGHDLVTQSVEPTCVDKGYVRKSCTRCEYQEYTEIAAFGHDWQTQTVAPTCTEAGYTEYTCARCRQTYRDSETKALGHDLVTQSAEPTCVDKGYVRKSCTRCEYQEYTEIAALGHDWQTQTVAPTCTEAGYTEYTCARCRKTDRDSETKALGHDYKAVVTKPTCTEAGYTTYTCTRCKDTYQADPTAAAGHTWDGGRETVKPTETTPGERTYTCIVCGAKRTETIPADGHTHHYQAVVTKPTCTEAGYTTYTCTKCGDSYRDGETKALGHDYKAVVTNPTCTEAGYTTHTCSRCKDTYRDGETKALGHDYQAVVTNPTCTAGGYTTHTCSRCEDTYRDEETKPLGHDYVNGKCTRCGEADPDYRQTVECPSKAFADVPQKGSWAHEGIDYCIANKLMNGISETAFAPNGTVTRGQLVTILYRMAGAPDVEYQGIFTDVPEGKFYTKAVEWAAANGIVNGMTPTTFAPDSAVTREQIAVILYRYSKSPEAEGDLRAYPDCETVSKYAKQAFVWATGEGLINGVASNGVTLLRPKANATRAQIAAIMMRYLQGSYECNE